MEVETKPNLVCERVSAAVGRQYSDIPDYDIGCHGSQWLAQAAAREGDRRNRQKALQPAALDLHVRLVGPTTGDAEVMDF